MEFKYAGDLVSMFKPANPEAKTNSQIQWWYFSPISQKAAIQLIHMFKLLF